jgi:hypothetical protein
LTLGKLIDSFQEEIAKQRGEAVAANAEDWNERIELNKQQASACSREEAGPTKERNSQDRLYCRDNYSELGQL